MLRSLVHVALVEADGSLMLSERIFSFFDVLYITTTKDRARGAFETVAHAVVVHLRAPSPACELFL